MMKKGILSFLFFICIIFGCFGCVKKAEEQIAPEDGKVTMHVIVNEGDTTSIDCTIFNKTKNEIMTGEEYFLQVLKDDTFVDVPFLPDAGGFNLMGIMVLADDEYGFHVELDTNYGELETGHYRIAKRYHNSTKQHKLDKSSEEKVSAEFDLP